MMKKLVTEFIGTFFLVLVVALTGNPVAIGFTLVALVYMGGYISGAHYNPAVTLGLVISKKIDHALAWRYIVAQMLGAVAAAFVFSLLKNDMFLPHANPHIPMSVALIVETLFTFLLVSVVHHVAATDKTKGNQYYGLAIGMTLLAAAFAGGTISGGAYNPAVGVGPLLFDLPHIALHWESIILYTVGPLTGGALAGWVYRSLM